MPNNRLLQFGRATLDVVAHNEAIAKRVIGYSYMLGDGIVASIPLVKNGFAQSLANGGPNAALLWQGLGGRPLPVVVSALWISAGFLLARGKFAASNAVYGTGMIAMISDLAINHECWSIAPMAVGLAGAGIGAFHRPLERRFSQSPSPFLRNTLGRPKQITGLLYSANTYPLLGSSILDKNLTLFTASVSWSFGSTLMMCLPRETPQAPNQHVVTSRRAGKAPDVA